MTLERTLNCEEMPRERLLKHGAKVLSNAELLAIIMRTGVKGKPVVAFCQDLLTHFGSLRSLLHSEVQTLQTVHGLGDAKIAQLLALQELAIRALEDKLKTTTVLGDSASVKAYCIHQLGGLAVEHCHALLLNKAFHLLKTVEVARGTLDQAAVYPREVVKLALQYHAAYVILAHNHPSGSTEPSQADLSITQDLANALDLIDIKLVDHLIVGGGQAISLAEQGYL